MEALVEMVREFGIVAEDDIHDKFGYKEIYNDALMELVNRVGKFESGELDINDYTIKGALEFVKALKKRGIKLYLASGTDITMLSPSLKRSVTQGFLTAVFMAR